MGASLKRPGLNVRDRLIESTRRQLEYALTQDSEFPGWSEPARLRLDDLLAGVPVYVMGWEIRLGRGKYVIEPDGNVREVSR